MLVVKFLQFFWTSRILSGAVIQFGTGNLSGTWIELVLRQIILRELLINMVFQLILKLVLLIIRRLIIVNLVIVLALLEIVILIFYIFYAEQRVFPVPVLLQEVA